MQSTPRRRSSQSAGQVLIVALQFVLMPEHSLRATSEVGTRGSAHRWTIRRRAACASNIVRELGPSGEVLRTDTERLTLRSLRSEMQLQFALADLEVVADRGDFLGGPSVYGREQVWVLRR